MENRSPFCLSSRRWWVRTRFTGALGWAAPLPYGAATSSFIPLLLAGVIAAPRRSPRNDIQASEVAARRGLWRWSPLGFRSGELVGQIRERDRVVPRPGVRCGEPRRVLGDLV